MPLLRRILSSVGGRTILVLFTLWAAYRSWMLIEAPGRIEPGLIERAEREGTIPITVQLTFPPERFHVLKIQEAGSVGRVTADSVEIRSVDADGIWKLARSYYWIAMIKSQEGTQKR